MHRLNLRREAIADTRMAPPAYRVAKAATITSDSTKKTTIQTKLSIMTNAVGNTSQFGSHETTINSRITLTVDSNVPAASALHASKTTRNRTAAAGTSAFQTGKPANSPPKNCWSACQ